MGSAVQCHSAPAAGLAPNCSTEAASAPGVKWKASRMVQIARIVGRSSLTCRLVRGRMNLQAPCRSAAVSGSKHVLTLCELAVTTDCRGLGGVQTAG